MTLLEAKNLARLIFFHNGGRADLDDLQLNALMNIANKYRWMQAAEAFMSMFVVESADLTTTGTGAYDYSALAAPSGDYATGVHLPSHVEFKDEGVYYRIPYEPQINSDQYQTTVTIGDLQPSAWTLIGEKIQLLPKPSATKTIRLTYVPVLADMDADSDLLLAGKMPLFHSLVVYDSIASLIPPASTGFFGVLNRYEKSWNEFMKSRQRGGRAVRHVPYE